MPAATRNTEVAGGAEEENVHYEKWGATPETIGKQAQKERED